MYDGFVLFHVRKKSFNSAESIWLIALATHVDEATHSMHADFNGQQFNANQMHLHHKHNITQIKMPSFVYVNHMNQNELKQLN